MAKKIVAFFSHVTGMPLSFRATDIMATTSPFQRSSLIARPWSNSLFITRFKVRPDCGNIHSSIATTRWNSTATCSAHRNIWNHHLKVLGTCQASAFSAMKQQYFSSKPVEEKDPIAELQANSPTHKTLSQGNGGNSNEASPPPLTLMLRDERLPVAQHLDPDGTALPTSDWIHINGTMPTGSLDQVLNSVEQILREEEQKGIFDLDTQWNPVQDPQVPLLFLDDILQQKQEQRKEERSALGLVEAAHVVLSPFGRPNGWHLKLPNRSLVYSLLDRSQQQGVRIGWKLVTVHEYHYSKEKHQREDPAFARNNGLIVDDSMIRIENCHPTMNIVNVRHMISRYELAHDGTTVFQWNGTTNDGKTVPRTFIVRFASPSWARAAVRDLQSTDYLGQVLRLVQYPKQIRYELITSNDYMKTL